MEVSAIALNTTCIRVQWKNPPEPIGGVIRGFKILASSETVQPSPLPIEITTTQQLFYWKDFCGLARDSKYRFNVTAKTVAYGKSSDNVEGTTLGYGMVTFEYYDINVNNDVTSVTPESQSKTSSFHFFA